jgi:DNA-binding NarL/FixJ family response regulator
VFGRIVCRNESAQLQEAAFVAVPGAHRRKRPGGIATDTRGLSGDGGDGRGKLCPGRGRSARCSQGARAVQEPTSSRYHHLPKKSGLEVLKEIKASQRLKTTPVVVVSGSDDPREVREAYELHASCYIRKPNDLHQFLQFIAVCYEFWGTVVTLPPKAETQDGVSTRDGISKGIS